MQLAHVGLGVAAIGATLVSYHATERDVRMAPGDHVELAGYRFVLHGVDAAKGPNYVADVGRVEVTGPHGETWLLHPEKRKYNASRMRMTEAAVESGLWRDLYVALGEHLGGGAWSVRVFHKPFVAWLWIGACLLALGGLLAAADRRYRNP
jgi:cytochrome c-type biogenesis protein CcmF